MPSCDVAASVAVPHPLKNRRMMPKEAVLARLLGGRTAASVSAMGRAYADDLWMRQRFRPESLNGCNGTEAGPSHRIVSGPRLVPYPLAPDSASITHQLQPRDRPVDW